MHQDKIVVIDFGSQYNQLIIRRIRELGVYAELWSHEQNLTALTQSNIKGVILSGGPQSVHQPEAQKIDPQIWKISKPILGICYGQQLMIDYYQGKVAPCVKSEYGAAEINILDENLLFYKVPPSTTVWMSHKDEVITLPSEWEVLARSANCCSAAMQNKKALRWGMQFHPEVSHSVWGMQMLHNFVFRICQAQATWSMHNYKEKLITSIRQQVQAQNVICGLSGGVDSAVTAAIIAKAINKQLYCIFINNGLLRLNEETEVIKVFKPMLQDRLIVIDARQKFYNALKNITDPETKRKVIGKVFVEVFEQVAQTIPKVAFLAQGTIYPDVVESGQGGSSKVIKSHHNVGGLPNNLGFKLLEPLRILFKDEVRKLGLEIGLPTKIINRHPFPGPGLAVRIIGQVNEARVKIVQEADHIVRAELAEVKDKLWQSFAILTNTKTVGVMGDDRSYCEMIAIRAVESVDGMTAQVAPLSIKLLTKIANRIVNEVKGVNRVVYDLTSKPPGTIEWE